MFRRLDPPVFQGSLKYRSYFEGWYVKNLTDDLSSVIAFIPGISLGEDRHAFIQVNTSAGISEYIRFPLKDFRFSRSRFDISIGGNRFSDTGVFLDIDRPGISVNGELKFRHMRKFPPYLLSPGIMGWYGFVPFMECYHGVVSMYHHIGGEIFHNEKKYTFNKGHGYIEKDWGTSFPRSWVWMQANPFQRSEASFMLSAAKIPWMGREFTGLIAYLFHDGKTLRFATYLGDKLRSLETGEKELRLELGKHGRRLTIRAVHQGGAPLIAPVKGKMKRSMKEALNAEIHVHLEEAGKGVVFSDRATPAGLEISGNAGELIKS